MINDIRSMDIEAAVVRLCGRAIGFIIGVFLIVAMALHMKQGHAATVEEMTQTHYKQERQHVCVTGQQGVTCYFPSGQNWSQGELSKQSPAIDGTCPGRYAYRDTNGFTLFCWGKMP